MENDHAPVRLQLIVNGEIKCIAGIDEFGVLHAIVGWVKRDPSKAPDYLEGRDEPRFSPDNWSRETLNIHVGGAQTQNYLEWVESELTIGDEVTIRILGPGPIDPPASTKPREKR